MTITTTKFILSKNALWFSIGKIWFIAGTNKFNKKPLILAQYDHKSFIKINNS